MSLIGKQTTDPNWGAFATQSVNFPVHDTLQGTKKLYAQAPSRWIQQASEREEE